MRYGMNCTQNNVTGLFASSEISAIFHSMDCSRKGLIPGDQAKQALRTILTSRLQEDRLRFLELDGYVDEAGFITLAQSILHF